jgi:hypothetical protein
VGPTTVFHVGFYALLVVCLLLVSCLPYISSLRIEAIRSSETSVHFHRTTQRYCSQARTLKYFMCLLT